MNKAISFLLNFLRSGTDASSKRLTMVLSYLVTLSLCTVALIFHFPIEANLVTLLLGCCGVSSTTYAIANKNEVKKADD